MKKNRNALLSVAALGLVGSAASIANAQNQYLVNISGATLLQSFFQANASTNDYIDVDGDGFARAFGTDDTLTPNATIPPPARVLGQNGAWLCVHYRATGSVSGLQELFAFGINQIDSADRVAPDFDQDYAQFIGTTNVDLGNSAANFGGTLDTVKNSVLLQTVTTTSSRWNRTQFISNGVPNNATIYHEGNPGGSPVRASAPNYNEITYTGTEGPASGGVRMDLAILDVPPSWGVRYTGTGAPTKKPGDAGYGNNLRDSVNKNGTPAGYGNRLIDSAGYNFNTSAPDATTIFTTPLCHVAIAVLTNFGTGLQQIDKSDLQWLNIAGRTKSGENFTFVTRDFGSGTRNAFCNSICLDPSYGRGENIGALSNSAEEDKLGPLHSPSNKNGSGNLTSTVVNLRLGLGYNGAEASNSLLTGGSIEVLAVRDDLNSGTGYYRPSIVNVLGTGVNNTSGAESYNIGGPESFASIGDPRNQLEVGGAAGNTNPRMRNPLAAAYVNNITRSVEAFTTFGTPFTPGEYIADNFILTAALNYIGDIGANQPCSFITNTAKIVSAQNYTLGDNILKDPQWATFGTVSLNGKVPTRRVIGSPVYSDGLTSNYINQNGASVAYGSNLTSRNRIAGDFDGNGLRNVNDVCDMLKAYAQRDPNDGTPWSAPNGTGAIAGAPGTDAVIEILGDFDGDGSFTIEDVRYFADGLVITGGKLNRADGFKAVDNCACRNFFGTTLATGKTYRVGDSRGDVAGGGQTPGWAPTGADGTVDAKDIDYVFANFGDWSVEADAEKMDLSADMNGDLIVDQGDVNDVVYTILCTEFGDRDLDGDVDSADLAGIVLGGTGWAQGDFDGNGAVDAADVAICTANQGFTSPCCPSDFDGSGFVDFDDFNAFVASFEAGCLFADFDGSTFVDFDDFNSFVAAFEAGC